MYSGGNVMDAQQVTAQVNDLGQQQAEAYDELVSAQGHNNELVNQANNETGTAKQHSAEEYNEAYTEQRKVESEEATAEARARNADDEVRRAGEQRDNFRHNIDTSWRELNPLRQRVASAFDMARFYQSTFDREFFSKWRLAILQTILENRNFGGAALLMFHAACIRMNAAALGTSSRVSAELYLNKYFQIPDLPYNKAPEQYAQAQSQAGELGAQERQLRDKAADGYYDEMVAEKTARHAEEKAIYDSEVAKLAKAQAAAESLKARRDRLDEEHRALTDRIRAQETLVAELKNNLTNLEKDESHLVGNYNRNVSEQERQRRAEAQQNS